VKAVILCGGKGTRLAEETEFRPKPLVEVGGKPLLWHIMRIYAADQIREFVLALGYKGDMIRQYFANGHGTAEDRPGGPGGEWKVDLVDTGHETMTGGRIWRLRDILRETFLMTYGDGVGNIDVSGLVEFHRRHGKAATVTAVRPPARFGALRCEADRVVEFNEKPQTGEGWINGGFFVFEPRLFDYLDGDDNVLERQPLERLAADGQLMAFRHYGFWRCMDTLRDKLLLEEIWQTGEAPWRVWE
jgi:glucose-1-phosphate cytidylyltransferase